MQNKESAQSAKDLSNVIQINEARFRLTSCLFNPLQSQRHIRPARQLYL
jgi:hypothetical protein